MLYDTLKWDGQQVTGLYTVSGRDNDGNILVSILREEAIESTWIGNMSGA